MGLVAREQASTAELRASSLTHRMVGASSSSDTWRRVSMFLQQ
jgi:hypothetical protein